MKKDDAERLIRYRVREWMSEMEIEYGASEMPSFSEFLAWLLAKNEDALDFRCRGGPRYVAEMWFDQETGQAWRN